MTGLFTTFGYGHAADIMPLGDLYRTQVLQLAEDLDVPKEIRDLAYTDIIPGVQNKYKYFFDLESIDVDKILVRLNAGLSPMQVCAELHIDIEKIDHVNHFFQVSKIQIKSRRLLLVLPTLHHGIFDIRGHLRTNCISFYSYYDFV